MKDVVMFEKLRNYLTKEYMRLSEEKEDLLSQKLRLETEEKKVKDLFYNKKKIEKRRRMFSPLDDILFDFARK